MAGALSLDLGAWMIAAIEGRRLMPACEIARNNALEGGFRVLRRVWRILLTGRDDSGVTPTASHTKLRQDQPVAC